MDILGFIALTVTGFTASIIVIRLVKLLACCIVFQQVHLYTTESELDMSINIKTSGAHHVALRTTNLERSKRFYTETLGFSIIKETPELFLFSAGNTAFGVRGPATDTVSEDKFNPHRVGLDHIALGCEDESELERVAAALTKAGVENTGVKLDETLGKRYVAFKDPDRIAWEFYMI